MVDKKDYQARMSRIRHTINGVLPGEACVLQPDDYLALFCAKAPGYASFTEKMRIAEQDIQRGCEKQAGLYNRLLVLTLLDRFSIKSLQLRLTDRVINLYCSELARIESQLDNLPDDFYHLDNDVFLKDLAILSGRLIPVGAEFVVPDAGIPKSWCLKNSIKGSWSVIRTCLQAGGFSPYLELHAHPLSLGMFNPEGWHETYLNLADLLEINPQLLGVVSSSWFLDPKLKGISPHLAYLRDIPAANGATLFFNSLDQTGTSGALATSKKRRSLFEQGEYVPAVYSRIWPKKQLIALKRKAAQ